MADVAASLKSIMRRVPGEANHMALGRAEVAIRPAISIEEFQLMGGRGLYLSLYEDEISSRTQRFCGSWSPYQEDPAEVPLEPTDTVLFQDTCDRFWVMRGSAATFPLYWKTNHSEILRLSTFLPILGEARFSRTGLVSAAAAAFNHGSYEPNAFVVTPLAQWRRIRRASYLRFIQSTFEREDVARLPWRPQTLDRGCIARRVRQAFDRYRNSQASIRNGLVEVSGGFDSTLAAALPAQVALSGISVSFPYYEFRFEEAIQRETADFLNIARVVTAGTDLFPFAQPAERAVLDEPAVFATGMKHAEHVARFAMNVGAQRIYVGHGGDQCFATDLLARIPVVPQAIERSAFSSDAWCTVSRALIEIKTSPWGARELCTAIYDARMDTWLKERFGMTYRTPFSDLDVLLSALDWSTWCREHGVRPNKAILAEAASDLLPDAVLRRRGKVAYDGVWMRAYETQIDYISSVFEQTGSLLTHLGFSLPWLEKRARDLSAWRACSNRELLAAFAISHWFLSWGISNPSDVYWAD